MSRIFIDVVPKAEIEEVLCEVIAAQFEQTTEDAKELFNSKIKPHLERLIDHLSIAIEGTYVDKVYRDSYYIYHSSKLNKYGRNCIRISFFKGDFTYNDLLGLNEDSRRPETCEGFIVLRPTIPQIIGRSIINPLILKEHNFACCTVEVGASVCGIKFKVRGFPHSSQDSETITCAETTIWALMEYFGMKYGEYRPVLPSKIVKVLGSVVHERQTPSRGLNIYLISFTIKQLGLASRVYQLGDTKYTVGSFPRFISAYIESGIPLIVALQNDNIAHAALVVGRSQISNSQIEALPTTSEWNSKINRQIKESNIQLFDFDDITKEFIFIDDNFPSYQKATLFKPTEHYVKNGSNEWDGCQVKHCIVPLPSKVYLEAYEAKNLCKNILFDLLLPRVKDREVMIRFYLTSSRSLKHHISNEAQLKNRIKATLLETSFPKFVWVCELTDKAHYKTGRAFGLILLDATEPNTSNYKPLIFAGMTNVILQKGSKNNQIEKIKLHLDSFIMYSGNLKSFYE